jgi:hypothetical protein
VVVVARDVTIVGDESSRWWPKQSRVDKRLNDKYS